MGWIKEYIAMNLKRRVEYKWDLFGGIVGLLIINISALLIVYIIIYNVKEIAGWSYWEEVFNYAFFLTSLGLHKAIFQNIENLEDYIINGRFDRLMLRPVSPFAQIVFETIHVEEITDFFGGIAGIIIASVHLQIELNVFNITWIIFCVINGTIVFTLILSIISTLSFWLDRVYPILYGTMELQEAVQNYPITIYNKPLRFILTYILPYAAVNYYPSLVLLKKVPNAGNTIIYMLSVDIVLGIIQKKLWENGIKKYESSGG